MDERQEKGRITNFKSPENREVEPHPAIEIAVAGIPASILMDPFNLVFVGLPPIFPEIDPAKNDQSTAVAVTESDSALIHFFNLIDFKYADWRLDYKEKDNLWLLRQPNGKLELRLSTREQKKFGQVGTPQYYFDLLRLPVSFKQPLQNNPQELAQFISLHQRLKQTQSDIEAAPVLEAIKQLLLKNRQPEPKYAFGKNLLVTTTKRKSIGVVGLNLD